MATCGKNCLSLHIYNKERKRITIKSNKSVYTYQIDAINQNIIDNKLQGEITWQQSINNTRIITECFRQIAPAG